MKRKRSSTYVNRPFKKPRTTRMPIRTYKKSLVPLASRGYRFNSTELKVFDINTSTYNVSNTTLNATSLCTPTLGTSISQRIGRKIVIKSVQIRGFINTEITNNAATRGDTLPQHCRCMLVWDTQPNGTQINAADLLNTADASSQLNLDNRDRFRVLWSKEWVLDPFHWSTTATQTYISCTNQIKLVKKYKKLNLEVIFNAGNSGTFADISTGNLAMCWIGNSPAGAGSDSNFVGSTRVRFADP